MAGKTGKGKITRANASGSRKKPVTGHEKAGLVFSVGRIARFLKRGRYSDRFGRSGAVFLAGVLEYLANEVLELAGNAAEENKKKTIFPRHIAQAIRNDEELNKMMANSQFTEGGFHANIQEFLFPVKAKGKGGKADGTQEL